MMDARTLRRLAAMDIAVWRRRRSRDPAPASAARPTAERDARVPRIRLEAGNGEWLVVVDDIERSRHERLLGDIVAAIGAGRCRFGSWSDSPESGVAVDEWPAHGIRRALVFDDVDPPPDGFIAAGTLTELAASGAARRVLWGRIRPLLEV